MAGRRGVLLRRAIERVNAGLSESSTTAGHDAVALLEAVLDVLESREAELAAVA